MKWVKAFLRLVHVRKISEFHKFFFRLFTDFQQVLVFTQLIFTCSKSTIETLEKGMKKTFKVNNKNSFFYFLLKVDYEEVNIS